MDPVEAQLNAIRFVLTVVGVLLGFLYVIDSRTLDCDPDCKHCATKREDGRISSITRRMNSMGWCVQHHCPKHECRDAHRE